MTAFVLAVCLVSYGFAHYYVPPSPEYRLWPDLSPTTATMAAIVGANVFICIAWRFAPLWPLLTRYFMHVPGYPRAVQSVLNVFSHVQYEHILSNMMSLLVVGPVCLDLVGRGVFLGTYISAGAVGTLASLYWANLGRGNIGAHSVGASAAIWGIAALYCLLSEQNTLVIPFVKDLEVSFYPKLLFGAFVVMEILTARKFGKGTADHASHFGGMAAGMAVAGYMHMNGWRPRVGAATLGGESVRLSTGMDGKTVDPGLILKEEAVEVKDAVKKVVKKE
jgi:rhomboid-like protein